MSERRYKLLNGFTLIVSEECLGVQLDTGMTITTDGDEIIDDVLALLDHTVSEKKSGVKKLFGNTRHLKRMMQPVLLYTSTRKKLTVSNWSLKMKLSVVPES
ncbi:hypothetical protein [Paenibacillus sp. 1A_MP2]|uniref:hypothetical protein n=1 Tax=Paenibacillus sp. 1A_MP2 TaxID=3457495 RepID=UPI003FCD8182